GRARCARRPERLRSVANRSQILLHPDGGNDVRQRAAELRAEARGLGFAELSRRCHGCDPLCEACARPRNRRRTRRAFELFYEGSAATVHRRRSANEIGSVLQRRRRAGVANAVQAKRQWQWISPEWPPQNREEDMKIVIFGL